MKKGFTLAEVLITLGIIGVVAALAAPALNNSTQKAKVGPALSKFINTMETAHEHIIVDNQADSLSTVTENNVDTYITELTKYAKGVKEEKTLEEFTPKPANFQGQQDDGSPIKDINVAGIFTFADGSAMAIDMYPRGSQLKGGTYKGNVASVWFDINGFDKKPNRAGKDEFRFYFDDSGSVYPDGGKTKMKLEEMTTGNKNVSWETRNGFSSCNKDNVTTGIYCGASVVDNGFKVIYKY